MGAGDCHPGQSTAALLFKSCPSCMRLSPRFLARGVKRSSASASHPQLSLSCSQTPARGLPFPAGEGGKGRQHLTHSQTTGVETGGPTGLLGLQGQAGAAPAAGQCRWGAHGGRTHQPPTGRGHRKMLANSCYSTSALDEWRPLPTVPGTCHRGGSHPPLRPAQPSARLRVSPHSPTLVHRPGAGGRGHSPTLPAAPRGAKPAVGSRPDAHFPQRSQ